MNEVQQKAADALLNPALNAILSTNGLEVMQLESTPLWVTTDNIVESTITCSLSKKGNHVFKVNANGVIMFVHAGAEYQPLADGEYKVGDYQAMLDIRIPSDITLKDAKKAYPDNEVAVQRWADAKAKGNVCRLVVDSVLS
jgi:hypothetical protein